MQQLQVRENVTGFQKALGAVEVIEDQIQYRSQSLLKPVATLLNPPKAVWHWLYLLGMPASAKKWQLS